jgi:anti-sigma factor RsiW
LPKPDEAEGIALASVDSLQDVRLACRVRPTDAVAVTILKKPGEPQRRPVEFVEITEAAGAHVRAALSGTVADLVSGDTAGIHAWLSPRVPHTLPVIDLDGAGFRLVGARLDFLNDRPAAVLVYSRGNTPVSLFVLDNAERVFVATRAIRSNVSVLGWSEGDLVFFAVASLPLEALDALDEALHDAIAKGEH